MQVHDCDSDCAGVGVAERRRGLCGVGGGGDGVAEVVGLLLDAQDFGDGEEVALVEAVQGGVEGVDVGLDLGDGGGDAGGITLDDRACDGEEWEQSARGEEGGKHSDGVDDGSCCLRVLLDWNERTESTENHLRIS